jgi:hypothetical protein
MTKLFEVNSMTDDDFDFETNLWVGVSAEEVYSRASEEIRNSTILGVREIVMVDGYKIILERVKVTPGEVEYGESFRPEEHPPVGLRAPDEILASISK